MNGVVVRITEVKKFADSHLRNGRHLNVELV